VRTSPCGVPKIPLRARQRVARVARVEADRLHAARRDLPAARGLLQETAAQEVRLEHLFDRVLALADRRGDRLQADRQLGVLRHHGQNAPVELLEAVLVDAQTRERVAGEFQVHRARSRNLGEVAHAAQEAVGDARRAARALGDQLRARGIERDTQDRGRAHEDAHEVLGRIGDEAFGDAEARAERGREQALARGRADEREGRELQRHDARVRTLVDREIDAEVLHGRVEVLLDGCGDAVHLVDEEHVAALELRQDPHEVARSLERRAARGNQARAELVRQDARQAGLAQARWTREEHVVERLAAGLGGLDRDAQVGEQSFLAHELGQVLGPQAGFEVALGGAPGHWRLRIGLQGTRIEDARPLGHAGSIAASEGGREEGSGSA